MDRTFNYDARRAYELLEFMISLDTTTRFQLEVSGDILTEPVLELLTTARKTASSSRLGCSPPTRDLQAVSRQADHKRLAGSALLKEKTTVRVLLDLIAGLPEEGFWRFGESSTTCTACSQTAFIWLSQAAAGFTPAEEAEPGCVYTDQAPYEVLYTKDLSFRNSTPEID